MIKPENEVRTAIRGWVLSQNKKVKAEQLLDETLLLETRVISSLKLMELVLFVEDLRGTPIPQYQLQTGVFRSIDSIVESFFKAP